MTYRHAPLAISLTAAAALAVATPAAAEHDSVLGLSIGVHVHDVLRELGHVPQRIHARHRAHLDVFLGGRTYYAPHRHHHATYRFPVWVDGAVVYRPYVYCDDVLFASSGARYDLWYGDPYPSAGYWCAHCRGYYPRGHAHFRYDSRPRYDVPHGRYRGHDDHRGYGYWSGHREHHGREHHYREHQGKHGKHHDHDKWRGRGHDRRHDDHRDRGHDRHHNRHD